MIDNNTIDKGDTIHVIRLLGVLLLILATFAIFRYRRSSLGRLPRVSTERQMPYCLKCESNRQVVINAGEEVPPEDYQWFCRKCREYV